MRRIDGLPVDETVTAERLIKQIKDHRVSNERRSLLMDHKALLDRMSFVSDQKNLRAVLGWPSKAVETLARRCRLEGFAVTGGEAFGVPEMVERTKFLRRAHQGELSSLVHGVAFEVVTKGGDGEPPVMITHTSALNGTGDWDDRLGRMTSFLSVAEWNKRGTQPEAWTLHLPGVIWTVRDGRAVKSEHVLEDRIPVEPLVYKPRLDRPFGSSRISRAVIYLTQSACRVVIRSEATADLYSAPGLLLMGLTVDQIADGSWRQGIGNVIGIPDADAGPADAPQLARATVERIQQASQEPHIAQLRAWAQLFAGETSIPVSSLGISVDKANPTSAESYAASREDLISEAEDATDEWGAAHRQTMLNAWALANGTADVPDDLLSLASKWRDVRNPSRAATADAFVKLVGAIPELARADSALDMLGLDPDLAARLRSDLRQQRASQTLDALIAMGDGNAG